MKDKKVILRFDDVTARDKYVLRQLQGTVTPDSMIRLISAADLKANPREAKKGDVTDEIEETLTSSPQLFPFKSKGLLVAAADSVPLERQRFELTFEDDDIEGVLDGGHNLLAIALHILRSALGEDAERVLRKVRRWEDVIDVWAENIDRIEQIKPSLQFLTPVEVVYPQRGAQGRDDFQNAILAVARARNNNAELTEETKANKAGYYEAIREALDPKLVSEIEWKTNDGGRIKVRDLVALSWVALSKLRDNGEELPGVDGFDPVSIYNSKGACVAALNDLMESDKVSVKAKGEMRQLTHAGVKAAFSMMKDLPRLYDLIYSEFPEAYNSASAGFGRIESVYIWDPAKVKSKDSKYLRKPPHTKFYRYECKYDFPDGFIMPLVWSLSELMEYKGGKVGWKPNVNPDKFIRDTLHQTLKVYYGMINLAGYDPQKVGKTASIYTLAANDFQSRLKA
jgi:hypothetical protein